MLEAASQLEGCSKLSSAGQLWKEWAHPALLPGITGTARFLSTTAAASIQPCHAGSRQNNTCLAWPLQKKSSDAFLTGSATEAFIHAHTKHAGDLVSLKFC